MNTIQIPNDMTREHYRNISSYYPISCQDFITHYCIFHKINNIPQDFMCDTRSCMIMLYWDFLQHKPNFIFYKDAFLKNCAHHQRYDVIKYLSTIIIQRQWKIYTKNKNKAAKIIQHAMHNWLWKPICKDGTIGINLRLGLKMIKEMNLDR
jgi:hypothetical protein